MFYCTWWCQVKNAFSMEISSQKCYFLHRILFRTLWYQVLNVLLYMEISSQNFYFLHEYKSSVLFHTLWYQVINIIFCMVISSHKCYDLASYKYDSVYHSSTKPSSYSCQINMFSSWNVCNICHWMLKHQKSS